MLDEFVNLIEKYLDVNFENLVKLRIMFYVVCVIERMILNNGLVYDDDNIDFDKKIIELLKKVSLIFKNVLFINLIEDEIYYIVDIIKWNLI